MITYDKLNVFGRGSEVHTLLYNYFNNLGWVIDYDDVGVGRGWFVFRMPCGLEIFIGLRGFGQATNWNSDNISIERSQEVLHIAYSDNGGWDINVDNPNTTMFSNALNGRWAKIEGAIEISGTNNNLYINILKDDDFLLIFFNQDIDSWSKGLLFVNVEPRNNLEFSTYNSYIFRSLSFNTNVMFGNRLFESGTYGFRRILWPGTQHDQVSPDVTRAGVLDSNTQPDPLTNKLFLDPIYIASSETGMATDIGSHRTDLFRKVSSAIPELTQIQDDNGDIWIVFANGYVVRWPGGSP